MGGKKKKKRFKDLLIVRVVCIQIIRDERTMTRSKIK